MRFSLNDTRWNDYLFCNLDVYLGVMLHGLTVVYFITNASPNYNYLGYKRVDILNSSRLSNM